MFLSGKCMKPYDKHFVYWFIFLSYFIVTGFLLQRGAVPQFKYVIFHLITCFFTIYGYITNSRDQLGLMAQLVEYCAGISQVIGSDPIQA